MKLLPSICLLAVDAKYTGDGSKPIDDVLRRLGKLKEWGNNCAANLIPDAKNNILRKLYNFDRNAVKYYNNHNADFGDVDEPAHWLDLPDRAISTENPCECLYY